MLRSVLIMVFLLSGCTTMTKEEQEEKRDQLDMMAKNTVEVLIEQQPELQQQLDDAVGYAVADIKITKVPVIGAGFGEGVLFDNERDEIRYLKIKRLDLGGGLGARSYKALLILPEREQFDEFKEGQTLRNAGVEVSAGSSAKDSSEGRREHQFYLLADGGASATVTARAMKVSIDKKLTDGGV